MTRDEIISSIQGARRRLTVPRSCCADHRRHETEVFYRTLTELHILRQMLTAINEEREACAKMCEDAPELAQRIRARGTA